MTTTKQQFIQFLKQNNIYEKYVFNFNHKRTIKINFIKFLNNVEPFNLIYNAFPWHRTEEGISTWNKLSKQWIEKLQIPQLFIKFLNNNNIYKQYITNLIESNKKEWIGIKINSIEDVFNNYQPIDYINIYISTLYDIKEKIKWEKINIQWNLLLQLQYDNN